MRQTGCREPLKAWPWCNWIVAERVGLCDLRFMGGQVTAYPAPELASWLSSPSGLDEKSHEGTWWSHWRHVANTVWKQKRKEVSSIYLSSVSVSACAPCVINTPEINLHSQMDKTCLLIAHIHTCWGRCCWRRHGWWGVSWSWQPSSKVWGNSWPGYRAGGRTCYSTHRKIFKYSN